MPTKRHAIAPRRNLRHARFDHVGARRSASFMTSSQFDLGHERCSERSYLFTMSDIAHRFGLTDETTRNCFLYGRDETRLVEPDGIEPTTSCLQSRRSPN